MKKTKFIVCMLFLVSVIVCITGCTIQSRNIGLNVTYSNTASYTAKATVTISNIDLNSLNSSDQINLSKVTIFYAYDSVKQKYLDSIASSDPTSGYFIYPDNTKIDGSVSYTVLSNEVNAFKLSNKNSWSHDFDITFLDEAKNREISYVVLLEGNDIGMINGMTFGAAGYATSKVFKFNEPEHHPRVEPTCTEDGNIEYWTKFGVYYSDKDCTQVLTPDTAIAKLGHDWDEPEYTWDKVDNEWICVAKRVCKRDADHVETETADIAVRIDTDPTCEENGSTTYTATFDNPDFEKQTHTESDIAAIGHKFIHFIKWVWDGF
ncbi:MAG: hypothetical protein VZR27_11440, partial [Acutalibacteraceae bacterium]|nr:hypothetical protein [Acutalibacteraceae bacterium]